MFGFDSLTVKGKTFTLLDGESMVFKLGGEALEEALALEGAARWNPFGHEKKEWVQVPAVYAEKWEVMAESALAYVESLIIAP